MLAIIGLLKKRVTAQWTARHCCKAMTDANDSPAITKKNRYYPECDRLNEDVKLLHPSSKPGNDFK